MLLNKDRCYKCRSERAVRKCPRLRDKLIGWKCCNDLRIDLGCPTVCPYAPRKDENNASPFPAFRADSNTEYVQVVKSYIDFWMYQPLTELDDKSPAEYAAKASEKMLAWLGKFKYPANFPISYLMQKLELEHEETEEPETPESVTFGFFDAVVTREWDKLRSFSVNEIKDPQLEERYRELLADIPQLKKTKKYEVLHAGAADDGVSAIVVLELNNKKVWTVLLSSVSGRWRIKQNMSGTPSLYYAQNEIFRQLAKALGEGRDQESWDLLQKNLPQYPDCADLYYYRALYWQLTNQMDKAKADFLNAYALDNHFFAAGFTLSTLYLSEKELEKAKTLLSHLREEKPEDLNVRNNLAACEAGLGNTETAIEIWHGILKTAPTYEPARKNLERYEN
jgi:tetratricopeptide (TPR) repeat protein